MTYVKNSLDEVFEQFDLSPANGSDHDNAKPVTFWIPQEYKSKYAEIQERTNGKLGKILKEVIKKSIDRAELEASI